MQASARSPTQGPAASETPIQAAMKTIIQAMQEDPSYAWSWHCNIAMAFVDAGGDHYTGNQAAANFLRTLAKVEPAHELPEKQELSNLKRLAASFQELNMSNYTSDDVDELNNWAIEVATAIDALAKQSAPVQQKLEEEGIKGKYPNAHDIDLAGLTFKYGPDCPSRQAYDVGLAVIKAMHDAIEEQPGLVKRVTGELNRLIGTSPQPAQKEWVELTDAVLHSMCNNSWVFDSVKQWYDIISAKLKEKNHG